jgi:predicted short-subunit dehydrogenase-like oxidoreductase (DUF2520 family)
MHDDIASRAIGDNFTFGENDASISNSGNNLNIMGGDDHGMAISSKLSENLDQPLFCAVVESSSWFIEQQQWWFRCQHD